MAIHYLQSNMEGEGGEFELGDRGDDAARETTGAADGDNNAVVMATTDFGGIAGITGVTTDVTLADPLSLSLQGQVRQTAIDTVYKQWGLNAGGPPSGGRFPDNFVYTKDGLRLKNYPNIRLTNIYNDEPLALSTIARGIGVKAIREELGFSEYGLKLPAEDTTAARKANEDLSVISTEVGTVELQDLGATAGKASSIVGTMETTFSDAPEQSLPLREIRGLNKALQTIRGELVNNLAKLTELDNHITREQNKLDEPDIGEFERRRIAERLRNLKDERVSRLEAASASREALRSQISRIRDTINRLINEDTALAERIRTLFREQGITIVSILTALGMVISTLVLAVEMAVGGAGAAPPAPSKGGLREWVKKYLHALGRVLAKLAAKAGAALPGIIGSVVGWLLNLLSKTVGWLASNLWALMLAVGSILLITAREWLAKR